MRFLHFTCAEIIRTFRNLYEHYVFFRYPPYAANAHI
nr:MAG TPA: hypothetical protein [Caudoviricetes sp.]